MTDLIQTIGTAAKDVAVGLFSQRNLAKLRPQPQERVDPEKARLDGLNHLQERLLSNPQDRTSVILGEHLKRANGYLIDDFKQAKGKDPSLTPEDFVRKRTEKSGWQREVPGFGWNLDGYHGTHGKPNDQEWVLRDLTATDYTTISSSMEKVWNQNREGSYYQHDHSARLTLDGHQLDVSVRGIRIDNNHPAEKAAGISAWAQTESPTGKGVFGYLIGKSAVTGIALSIAPETDVALLKSIPPTPR